MWFPCWTGQCCLCRPKQPYPTYYHSVNACCLSNTVRGFITLMQPFGLQQPTHAESQCSNRAGLSSVTALIPHAPALPDSPTLQCKYLHCLQGGPLLAQWYIIGLLLWPSCIIRLSCESWDRLFFLYFQLDTLKYSVNVECILCSCWWLGWWWWRSGTSCVRPLPAKVMREHFVGIMEGNQPDG